MRLSEFINQYYVTAQAAEERTRWLIDTLEHGLAHLGYEAEVGEFQGFYNLQVDFTAKGVNNSLSLLALAADHAQVVEYFQLLDQRYRKYGLEIKLLTTSTINSRPIYATKTIASCQTEKHLVALADLSLAYAFDLSHIVPLDQRLRALRKEWGEAGHIAIGNIDTEKLLHGQASLSEAPGNSLASNIDTALFKLFSEVAEEFAQKFNKLKTQPDELTNVYFTFAGKGKNIISENGTLIRGIFPHVLALIIDKYAQMLGHAPSAADWQRISLESIQNFIQALAFLSNGTLGAHGQVIKPEHIRLVEQADKSVALVTTPSWEVYCESKRESGIWNHIVRQFNEDLAPISHAVFFQGQDMGFNHGKGGACPLGGKIEGMDHGYDILTKLAYDAVTKLLKERES
jgi:hypothetical protein